MREFVIDLGDDWTVPPPEPRKQRKSAAAFLAVLMLPLLVAGAPKGVPNVTEVTLLSVPDDGGERAILDGLIVVATNFGRLNAFDLDGRARWRARLDAATDVLAIQMVAGLVYVTADTIGRATFAFDPETGRQVWSAPGELSVVDDAAILVHRAQSVTVFDAATMAHRWSAEAVAAQPLPSDRTILLLAAGGAISERDLATGRPLREGRIRPLDRPRLRISRDRIVVRGALENLWLDRETLRPTTPAVHWSEWRDCGEVICGRIDDGQRTLIIDPGSGRVLQSLPEGNAVAVTPAGLLVMADDAQGSAAVKTIDPFSGRTRIPLSGWYTVSGNALGSVRPLLVWPTHRMSYVARLHADGLLMLASVPHELSECLFERQLLLCSTSQGRLGLWRVRSGNGA